MADDADSTPRRFFTIVERGYDPEEVDRHLAELAAPPVPAATEGVATVAADAAAEVRSIAESAEEKVVELQARAEQEVTQKVAGAESEARRITARAQERERALEDAATALLDQLGQVEQLIDQVTAGLKEAAQAALGEAQTAMDGVLGTVGSSTAQLEGRVSVAAGSLHDALQGLRRRVVEGGAGEEPVVTPPAPAPPAGPPAPVARAPADGDPQPGPQSQPESPPPDRDGSRDRALLVAQDMAMSGSPREQIERHLRGHFDVAGVDEILDESDRRRAQS